MGKLEDQIRDIANRHLKEDSHFIVDVVITAKAGPSKVLVLLDGDSGVSIDDCVELSRAIGNEVEESGTIQDAYRLEVSSPGVDFPLALPRQYKKNIGRTVKVTLQDGKESEGVLKNYEDSLLRLETTEGKGKNKQTKEVEIPLSNIKKTIVQISFK